MVLAYAVFGLLYGLFNLILVLRAIRAVRVLADLRPPEPPRWPKVSLIIPACNEADTLEAALRSRLQDDYPELEIILINDRSDDATGTVVDRLAAEDPRIRALHIHALPPGWLGKVHALHEGTELATGQWLLFTDADVHHAPGTLRRSVAYALQRRLDHLAVMPEIWPSTFLLDTTLAFFVRVLAVSARVWAIENPRSSASAGVGAFNLVRREALERSPGLEWLRLEVVDDAALGQMLKRSGARCGFVNGRGLVGLHWYRSVMEFARGAEKSALASIGRFSLLRLLLVCWAVLAMEWASLLSLLSPTDATVRILGAAGLALTVGAQLLVSHWFRRPLLPSLLTPLGPLILVLLSLRAGILGILRGGLLWRGTLYPNRMLRSGARFRFP